MNDGRDRTADGSGLVLAYVLGAVLAIALLVWLWAAVAGFLFGSGVPSLNEGELGRVLANLPGHLADPRLAWPANARRSLPGALGSTPLWSYCRR
jgi:type IV secretion system protein VirD4